MGQAGMFRIFHPIAAEYPFLSNSNGAFARIDRMLGEKAKPQQT
jgi:hypothetical protein